MFSFLTLWPSWTSQITTRAMKKPAIYPYIRIRTPEMVLEGEALRSTTTIVSLAVKLLLPLVHQRSAGGGLGVACPVALWMSALNRVVSVVRAPPLARRGVDNWIRTAQRGYRVLR